MTAFAHLRRLLLGMALATTSNVRRRLTHVEELLLRKHGNAIIRKR